jgi:hypothetical protein
MRESPFRIIIFDESCCRDSPNKQTGGALSKVGRGVFAWPVRVQEVVARSNLV